MSTKWSAFTAGSAISGTDTTVGLQGGGNVKWTYNQAATFFWAAPSFAGITTTGGGIVRFVRVVTGAGTVTAATSDDIIIINKASGAATTVNLFATPATGTCLTIKDGKGDAATNNITITPAAGNIDGAGTFVMTQSYQSASFVYNGTQWNQV